MYGRRVGCLLQYLPNKVQVHLDIMCVPDNGKRDTPDVAAKVWPLDEELKQASSLLRVFGYEVLVEKGCG
jgi:hypothetical protein